MAGLVYLKLPPLPHELNQALLKEGQRMPVMAKDGRILTEYHGVPSPTNSNTDNWGTTAKINNDRRTDEGDVPQLPWELVNEVRSIIQPYFKVEIFPIIIKFTNNTNQDIVNQGPHCDIFRTVGINYHLQLGGPNVLTNVYKQTRKDLSTITTEAEDVRADEVELLQQHHIPLHQWHVLDVQRYHAVMNLTREERIFLSLTYPEKITYNQFTDQYIDLIGENNDIVD